MILEDYRLEGEIRGHHVYKSAWTPVLGRLDVQVESANGMTDMPFLHF